MTSKQQAAAPPAPLPAAAAPPAPAPASMPAAQQREQREQLPQQQQQQQQQQLSLPPQSVLDALRASLPAAGAAAPPAPPAVMVAASAAVKAAVQEEAMAAAAGAAAARKARATIAAAAAVTDARKRAVAGVAPLAAASEAQVRERQRQLLAQHLKQEEAEEEAELLRGANEMADVAEALTSLRDSGSPRHVPPAAAAAAAGMLTRAAAAKGYPGLLPPESFTGGSADTRLFHRPGQTTQFSPLPPLFAAAAQQATVQASVQPAAPHGAEGTGAQAVQAQQQVAQAQQPFGGMMPPFGKPPGGAGNAAWLWDRAGGVRADGVGPHFGLLRCCQPGLLMPSVPSGVPPHPPRQARCPSCLPWAFGARACPRRSSSTRSTSSTCGRRRRRQPLPA